VLLSGGPPGEWSFERSASERLSGKGALGHQFVLFGIPVTRLYLERPPDEFLAECALSGSAARSSAGAVSNLSAAQLHEILGPNTRSLALHFGEVSANVYDLFLLRRLSVKGTMSASVNGRAPIDLAFEKEEYSKSGSEEILTALLQEAVEQTIAQLTFSSLRQSRSGESGSPPQQLSAPLIVCPPVISGEDAAGLAIQRGWERELKASGKPFISFRTFCPSEISKPHYRLRVDAIATAVRDSEISIAGRLTLLEVKGLEGAGGASSQISKFQISESQISVKEIETALPIERRVYDSESITTELVAAALLRQFFQQ